MEQLILTLGMMSFQATVAILAVLILRVLFKKLGISKKYVMFLWFIPFWLLICPWKISLPVGLWSVSPMDLNTQYTEYAMTRWTEHFAIPEYIQGKIQIEGIDENGNVAGQWKEHTDYQPVLENEQKMEDILLAAEEIWAAGVISLFLYAAISYVLLQKKLKCCVKKGDNIYLVDGLVAPIAAGMVKPKIYLPSGTADEYAFYVIEHEKTHIFRKDPFTKLAAYIITCIHWFNPMVWLAYYFLEKDMEMACDEETLQGIGLEKKKEYAIALLELSQGKRRIVTIPLAFGEGDTKGRIKNMMHYKKTVKQAAILAGVLVVLIFIVFVTKRDTEVLMTNNPQGSLNLQSGNVEEQEKEIAGGVPTGGENSETVYQNNEEIKELTFEQVREAAANHTLHELDFHSFSNGEEWYFEDKNFLNYYVNFYFEYEGEVYEIGASHWLKNGELGSVYITRESDKEIRWLYRAEDDGTHSYSGYLEQLLAVKENVDDWLSIELPEGYFLGEYQANHGVAGGALIYPQAYEVFEEELSAPEEWYYAGFIGQIPEAQEVFGFKNGELIYGGVNWWNHSTHKKLEKIDLDWQALMTHYIHDLYTGAGMAVLEEEKGVDLSSIDTVSDYWYFFFAKEGEERAYYLSLSQKLFTKEEAIAIAETVDIFE